jgi:hypothetical protein
MLTHTGRAGRHFAARATSPRESAQRLLELQAHLVSLVALLADLVERLALLGLQVVPHGVADLSDPLAQRAEGCVDECGLG